MANDAVVAADIIGGDAHADGFDERHAGHYAQHHVARGVATTLLLHSAGSQRVRGASPSELRLGTVSPLVGPEYVSTVLDELQQTLWFVHSDGELLRFEARQNLYRVIAETAAHQSQHIVDDRIRAELAKDAYGKVAGFRVLEWSGADGGIADNVELTVAVLAAVPRLRVQEDAGQPLVSDQKVIEDLWARAGGGFRQGATPSSSSRRTRICGSAPRA